MATRSPSIDELLARRESPVPRTSSPAPDDVVSSSRGQSSYLAQMRKNDDAQRAKYEGQMADDGLDPSTGRKAARASSVFPTVVDKAARGAFGSSMGGTIAGTALGGFAYFLGLAFFRGGSAGAKNWLKAKFANIVPGSTTSLPIGTATKTNTTTSGSTATAAGKPTTGAVA